MERRIQIHEWLYLGLGISVSGALALRTGMIAAALSVGILTGGYAWLLTRTRCGSVTRLVAAYGVTWALYAGSSVLVEWMQVPLRHQALLDWDRTLFGETPAVTLSDGLSQTSHELLALGYMSYHVYLHWALIEALCSRSDGMRADLGSRLFTAFGIGFIGYIAFPAAPPATAFPELFAQPLQGGLFMRLNESINAAMASRYDAFPSLHALIGVTLLAWDWSRCRRRFWLMLMPSVLMLAATLGLRFHYAVDLLVSAALFIMLTLANARLTSPSRRSMGA